MKFVRSLIVLSTVLFIDLQQKHGSKADTTCPKNCKPYVTIPCDENTGECSEGCNTGYYGSTCEHICPCDGGPCNFNDGKCADVPTVKPVPVSPGSISDTGEYTGECKMTVDPLVVCSICLLVFLILLTIFIGKEKILRMCKLTDQSQSEEERHLTSSQDQNQIQPSPEASRQGDKLTNSQRDLLIRELGVHFLNPGVTTSEPVILFCTHTKFDNSRVNTRKTRLTEDRYLVNEPDKGSREDSSERFKNFHGTCGVSSNFSGDCPTYWEVHCNVNLTEALQPTTVLLCIGFCREVDRDVSFQIPSNQYCYKLNVGLCDEHGCICTRIYRDSDHERSPPTDHPTVISNKAGISGNLNYGILVCKGRKSIMFFDVIKMKLLCCFENVDFDKPLWPMFGVFNKLPSAPHVSMRIEKERYIIMPQEKKDMIFKALSK